MRKTPILITSGIMVLGCVLVTVMLRTGDKRDTLITNYKNTMTTSKAPYVTANTTTTTVQPEPDYDDGDSDGTAAIDSSNPQMPGMGPGSGSPNINVDIPTDLEELIMLPFEDALAAVTGTTEPGWDWETLKYFTNDTVAKLTEMQNNRSVIVTVPIWKWASSDTNDLSKVEGTMNLQCNIAIEGLVKAVFQDLYESSEKPVFRSEVCGGYNIRNMGPNNAGKTSGHAFGCALDLNWDTMCNGVGNKMLSGKTTPTIDEWNALPECHEKYEIFYSDHIVVKMFKAYGFQWGGDWNTTDGMHFSFIGDNGTNARIIGQENYKQYKK